MKTALNTLVGIGLAFLLIGCSSGTANTENLVWSVSKEQAIKEGLEQEGVEQEAVFSVEENDGEILIYFYHGGGLGVANLAETDEGFAWYRNSPFIDFEGGPKITTASFNLETYSGKEIPILVGKALDPTVEAVQVTGQPTGDLELKIFEYDEARFFFSTFEGEYSLLNVSPMSNS